MSHPKYPHLFTPLQLGPITVPTRFFFAPHGSALTVGSKPADDLIAYSAARVEGGGCGMVVIPVVTQERARTRQPSPYPAGNVAAFKAYADAIHTAGGVAFAQCLYRWLGSGFWQVMGTPAPSLSPSVRQFSIMERSASTRAMGLDEIRLMVDSMRQSARHLMEAGFDGIMLHASHATMIEQFLSPYFNERTDEYGGSLDNRMRFLIEMLQAAREGSEGKLAVGIRLNCDEQVPGGYDTDTAREVLAQICDGGLVDYVDLDCGLEPQQFHHGMPTNFSDRQFYRPFVEKVRSAAGSLVPRGGSTTWDVTSSWASPSFNGAFLPEKREVSDKGFTAHYQVDKLALGQPPVGLEDYGAPVLGSSTNVASQIYEQKAPDGSAGNIAAGGASENITGQSLAISVDLIEPVNLYSKVDRAVKYGFLFIGFTFLAFLLFDVVGGARVAAAEYLLTGAGLVLFFVLLLAFAEVIGFTGSYIVAAAAIIGLLSAYSAAVLKSWKRGRFVGALLVGLYALLFVLLNLEAWSLVIGSVLLFVALAGVMYTTRNVDWSAVGRKEEAV